MEVSLGKIGEAGEEGAFLVYIWAVLGKVQLGGRKGATF